MQIVGEAIVSQYTQKNKWHQNRLIIRKMVPFRAPFLCHFPKGHCFFHTCSIQKWCQWGTKTVPFSKKKVGNGVNAAAASTRL